MPLGNGQVDQSVDDRISVLLGKWPMAEAKIGGKRTEAYTSLRLRFQILTCERAYLLLAVWPAEEVGM